MGKGRAGVNSQNICWDFRRNGNCRYGIRCRWSHDSQGRPGRPSGSSQAQHNPQLSGSRQRPANQDGKWQEWKQILDSSASASSRPAATTVIRFFQLGLELMSGDEGASQETIKAMASEVGLRFIKDLTDRHIPTAQKAKDGVHLWEDEIGPFFQLISHQRVVDSAVLEEQVEMIYRFLSGVGGARMVRVFSFILSLTRSWTVSAKGVSKMNVVELSLAVLSKIIDCNTVLMVNENLAQLVRGFEECLKSEPESSQEFAFAQARRYIEYTRQRLEVGQEIDTLKPNIVPVTREDFVLRRDLPGTLSAEGPRHDNDHAAISSIKVLPTSEEIMSPRREYLPTTDSSQWHIRGIRGRVDREFRLLREDTIGQLRNAVHDELDRIRNPERRIAKGTKNTMRTFSYEQPTPIDIEFDDFSGLQFIVQCNQPPMLKGMTAKKRRDWWMQSKRLQSGALVCVLDATGSVLFFVVSESTMRTEDDDVARRKTQRKQGDNNESDQKNILTLSGSEKFLFVTLQLVDAGASEVRRTLKWYRGIKSSPPRYIVEFPGVLLASFQHTLNALKRIYEQPKIPFSDLLAPSSDSNTPPIIEAPLYARKTGFEFDLNLLTNDQSSLRVAPRHPPEPGTISSRSSLDRTQSAALLSALTQELCLIQGPPGTGKSYTGEKIIKVLLDHKEQTKIGPILCVCYTNHALDQLLEHLLDDGVKNVIRIGSRSKSERLQNLNLRLVARRFESTRAERSELYVVRDQIRDIGRDIKQLIGDLADLESLNTLKKHLGEASPHHLQQLFGVTEDGWETVTRQENLVFQKWLRGGSQDQKQARLLSELQSVHLKQMTRLERRKIYYHWLETIRDPIIEKVVALHRQYTAAAEQRVRIRGDTDLRCLQEANIVGVTTTGLARQLDTLRKLRSKVMVCEEAGEVLEAHIITALLPSLESAILIGDHLQLRPQIQNYDLQSTNPSGQQYSLDMSLFERLVKPPHDGDARIPFSILETQRRMHPFMSELIRSTLYPSLMDSEAVKNYPKVVGMKERLFWFHHEHLEAAAANNDPLNNSKSNDFEIEMTTALVSHLTRQGEYSQGEIAVITPYLGQLHKLRRRMETMFEICVNDRDLEDLELLEEDNPEGRPQKKLTTTSKTTLLKSVRVATVDNFQGEEAKIIVISLVRSNPQNICGFLSTSNRINVLLSRAKHGMYIIGNSNSCRNVPMWAHVINIMKDKAQFGTDLELECPRHPNTSILVSHADHFVQFSPESGCQLPCEKRLDCGHACTGKCHSNIIHNAVKCLEPCPRLKKGCDHPCPRRCGDQCQPKCRVRMKDIHLVLECGHIVTTAECWEMQNPSLIRCSVTVTRAVPGCEHQVKVNCFKDITTADYVCEVVCARHLPCGHSCKSPCFKCNTREGTQITKANHGICKQPCGRSYSTCRHSCITDCHDGTSCSPCNQTCEVRCSHSICAKPCNEPCVPCAEEKCHSCCPHSECSMPCAAPCDWIPCSKRCEKSLRCGHQCPSLCGEACPDAKYCQKCASDETKNFCVDFVELKLYEDINLDEEPCIFPDCGHFLTVSSMDGIMEISAHYELNANGFPIKLRGPSTPFTISNKGISVCATCRGSLRSISRYGRIVRRSMLDETTKRFITWSNSQYLKLADVVFSELGKLEDAPSGMRRLSVAESKNEHVAEGSRLKILQTFVAALGDERYKRVIKLWQKIKSYRSQVKKKEQPFQRVATHVQAANRRNKETKEFQYDDSVIQNKGLLLAESLLLKTETTIISDFIKIFKGSITNRPKIKVDFTIFFKACDNLITLASSFKYPREQVQGHIFYARLCEFASYFASIGEGKEMEKNAEYKEEGLSHIMLARDVLERHPSTALLTHEIDSVESALRGVEYRQVTADELRAVYLAMGNEMKGTGHWYTCENEHPFTIGECGMPMEQARCPECDSPIGGQNHQAVDGMRRAEEIENLARDIENL